MPRYFIKLAYDGTKYHGWARQPNARTVQQSIEDALSMIFRKPIQIMGCGRTDTGVHASNYFIHVDLDDMSDKLLFRLNAILDKDIVLMQYYEVAAEAHARFDAVSRSYVYYAHAGKQPFLQQYSSQIIELKHINVEQLNQMAHILKDYDAFYPFCKAHGDNTHYRCALTACNWSYSEEQQQFRLDVSSNRFLRGMIRLIVGTCILVAKGTLQVDEVHQALQEQSRLRRTWSAPPTGLFLNKIEYPYDKSFE